MNIAKCAVFWLLMTVHPAFATEQRAILLGHNLSPTTEIPRKGSVSLGTYLLSYSPSDRLMLGSSSWMLWGYNSLSGIFRYRLSEESGWFDNLSLQGAYIKSVNILNNRYIQDIAILWLTSEHRISDTYQVFPTLNFMQFWDETKPFSFRREPYNDQSFQFSISSLHLVKWNSHWGAGFELGALGLNYVHPMMIFGASLNYLSHQFAIQFGLSFISRLPTSDTSSASNENSYYDYRTGRTLENTAPYTYHPEIQVQYFF